MRKCSFVSERSCICCQLLKGLHDGLPHVAWDENGNVIMKRWS